MTDMHNALKRPVSRRDVLRLAAGLGGHGFTCVSGLARGVEQMKKCRVVDTLVRILNDSGRRGDERFDGGLRQLPRGDDGRTSFVLKGPDQMALAGAYRPGEHHHRRGPVGPAFKQLERRPVGSANQEVLAAERCLVRQV